MCSTIQRALFDGTRAKTHVGGPIVAAKEGVERFGHHIAGPLGRRRRRQAAAAVDLRRKECLRPSHIAQQKGTQRNALRLDTDWLERSCFAWGVLGVRDPGPLLSSGHRHGRRLRAVAASFLPPAAHIHAGLAARTRSPHEYARVLGRAHVHSPRHILSPADPTLSSVPLSASLQPVRPVPMAASSSSTVRRAGKHATPLPRGSRWRSMMLSPRHTP